MQSDAFKERVKRLKEVNEVIEKLDPAIRAAAFSLLTEYVTRTHTEPKGIASHETPPGELPDDADNTAFFAKHQPGKPAENAVAITAYLYSQYGAQSFQLDDVRAMANSVGMTIPQALDMTLKQARRDGKSLFQHSGRNQYKPTVHGELYFQKTYSARKGKKSRSAAGNES